MGAPEHDRSLDGTAVRRVDRCPGPSLTASRAVAILEGIAEAVLVLDGDWRITFWNAAAERAVGLARADVLGRVLWERFPSVARTGFERQLHACLAKGDTCAFHALEWEGLDGRGAGTYDVHAWPIGGDELALRFTEVGGREVQRRELLERDREMAGLHEFVRAMVTVPDASDLLRRVCHEAMQRLGAHASLVIRACGSGLGECLAGAGAAAALEGARFPLAGSLVDRVLRDDVPVALESYVSDSAFFREVARETQLGAMMLVPLVVRGERLGVLAIARRQGAPPFSAADQERFRVFVGHASLAAWKARLLERAGEASEARATFLATMSHELRTPLTALTGYGELLADEIVGPMARAQHDIVDRMRAVTHQLTVMIDELLTYSSLEAGREYARVVDVSAAEIVEDAVSVAGPMARQKGLDFTADAAPAIRPLRTDPDKVRQILVNLLSNAVKFTKEGGHVGFRCTRMDDTVRFAVGDSGIGIAEAELPRLFQPFAQLDSGLTRRHGGTGLGLYISWRLAEMLGGRVEVRSTPGTGSTFTLVLPIAGPPALPDGE